MCDKFVINGEVKYLFCDDLWREIKSFLISKCAKHRWCGNLTKRVGNSMCEECYGFRCSKKGCYGMTRDLDDALCYECYGWVTCKECGQEFNDPEDNDNTCFSCDAPLS